MSGFRHRPGEPGRPPVCVAVSVGDALAATQGFVGALLGLFARDRPGGSGRGQLVDVAPAGRIYTARDIAGDPHYAARKMIIQVPEPALDGENIAMPGVVPKLSDTPGAVRRGGPWLREHNAEILGALYDHSLSIQEI